MDAHNFSMPVLNNHDQFKIIGKLTIEDNRLVFTSREDVRITRDYFFNIFPNAAVMFMVVDHDPEYPEHEIIKQASIFAFTGHRPYEPV